MTLVGVISTENVQAVLSKGEKANPIAEDQNAFNQQEQQSKTQWKFEVPYQANVQLAMSKRKHSIRSHNELERPHVVVIPEEGGASAMAGE